MILNISHYYQKFRIGYLGGVQYESILQKPTREGMLNIVSWIEEGKLRRVVGKTVRLEDIPAVREAFTQVSSGKGGTGKVVIESA
jgi:NADPH:quinone reductase-like Zn-dependent oxidoreductase